MTATVQTPPPATPAQRHQDVTPARGEALWPRESAAVTATPRRERSAMLT